MHQRQLRNDDRAVPPVVGVILMVAITVILAALVGGFVLGVGQDQGPAPRANFDFDWDGSSLTIIYEGGDSFTTDNTGNLSVVADSGRNAWSGGGNWTSAAPVTAGDSYQPGFVTSGDTVRIIWTSPDGEDQFILGRFKVPG